MTKISIKFLLLMKALELEIGNWGRGMGGFALLYSVVSAACVAWELSPAAGNNGVVAFL